MSVRGKLRGLASWGLAVLVVDGTNRACTLRVPHNIQDAVGTMVGGPPAKGSVPFGGLPGIEALGVKSPDGVVVGSS
jgi:hypothetical protein